MGGPTCQLRGCPGETEGQMGVGVGQPKKSWGDKQGLGYPPRCCRAHLCTRHNSEPRGVCSVHNPGAFRCLASLLLFARGLPFVPAQDYLVASHSPWSPTPCAGKDDLERLMLLPLPSEWEIIGVHHHAQLLNTGYQTWYFVCMRQACRGHKNITKVLAHFSGTQFLLLSYPCSWINDF